MSACQGRDCEDRRVQEPQTQPAHQQPAAEEALSSNLAKYQTTNPVVRRMIVGFFSSLREMVAPLHPASALDAGCGEGEGLARLEDLLGARIAAVDVEQSCVDHVRDRQPEVDVSRQSVLELGFPDDSFDLVLCLEVLEHLGDPAAAVAELGRVSAREVVVSVPYEPWFQLGSLLRGKHLLRAGNHPEHVNHYRRRSLARLLEPSLEVVEVRVAFPWLIARGRVRT
jgi:SAM-dependent methyltransferase